MSDRIVDVYHAPPLNTTHAKKVRNFFRDVRHDGIPSWRHIPFPTEDGEVEWVWVKTNMRRRMAAVPLIIIPPVLALDDRDAHTYVWRTSKYTVELRDAVPHRSRRSIEPTEMMELFNKQAHEYFYEGETNDHS